MPARKETPTGMQETRDLNDRTVPEKSTSKDVMKEQGKTRAVREATAEGIAYGLGKEPLIATSDIMLARQIEGLRQQLASVVRMIEDLEEIQRALIAVRRNLREGLSSFVQALERWGYEEEAMAMASSLREQTLLEPVHTEE